MFPKEVKRLGPDGLQIEWDNGTVHVLNSETLRKNCPSATSLMKRGDTSHDKPLSGKSRLSIVEASSEDELKLEKIWLVGNYAIGMRWGDGHDTGIFNFPYLFELGQKFNARPS